MLCICLLNNDLLAVLDVYAALQRTERIAYTLTLQVVYRRIVLLSVEDSAERSSRSVDISTQLVDVGIFWHDEVCAQAVHLASLCIGRVVEKIAFAEIEIGFVLRQCYMVVDALHLEHGSVAYGLRVLVGVEVGSHNAHLLECWVLHNSVARLQQIRLACLDVVYNLKVCDVVIEVAFVCASPKYLVT